MRFDRRAAGVMAAGFCTFLNVYTPQAILPTLADAFAVPLPRTALTITAPLLAVVLIAPFVGLVSDRLGRKRLIVGAAAALAVPTLLVATSGSLETMVLWRFLQGVLFPFIFTVTVAYIGDECEGGVAIRTAGSYASGTIAGGFVGRFVAGIAADYAGWRSAFVVLALMTAATAAFVALTLPPEQRFRPTGGGLRTTLLTYLEHLSNRRLVATCLIGFGMLFSVVATFTYVNFYLAAPPFGLSPGDLGGVFAVYLLGLVTASAATRLAVRIGRRPTLLLATALSGVGLLTTLLPSLGFVVAGLAAVVSGLFVVQSLSLGYIGAVARRAKSTAVGLYVSIYYIGGAVGGLVPAPLWHAFGWPGVVGLLLVVVAAIAGLALRFWREPA